MLRVLLVGGNVRLLDIWSEPLLPRRCALIWAENGASALELAGALEPDAAVIADDLPDMSGADVRDQLCRLDPPVTSVLVKASEFNLEVAETLFEAAGIPHVCHAPRRRQAGGGKYPLV